MKKRIRKKKHLKEFEKFGIIVRIDATESEAEGATECVNQFANEHNLYAWGGGHGYMSMQQVKKSYEMPEVVTTLLFGIMDRAFDDKLVFCLYSPSQQRVASEVTDALSATLAGSGYKATIGTEQINLWH